MISYEIFLLVNSHNKFSNESIESFKKIRFNSSIKKYISITKNCSDSFLEQLNLKGIQIIQHNNPFASLFEHMRWLTNFSKAEYISFFHDDDLFSEELLLTCYENLNKYLPVAFTTTSHNIDENAVIISKRKTKKINKILKLRPIEILNRYFLPFGHPVVLPAVAFNRKILNNYWQISKLSNLSIFEDVRIIYFFSKKGLFIEIQNQDLYLYRINPFQISQKRTEFDRLRLISWLRNIEIAFIYKLLLVFFSKLQYFLFYKSEYFSSKKLTNLFIKIRKIIIRLRVKR